MADHREMDEYGRTSHAGQELDQQDTISSEDEPRQNAGEEFEKHEKISSDDEYKKHDKSLSDDERRKMDLDPYRNESFHNSKDAHDYERKKANALLANPLRGYSDAELRQMGKNYALGRQACQFHRGWHRS